jgi:hypothetical protein
VSKGWKRYGEGRLYFIGGSVGLMVVLWSILFAQDHAASDSQATAMPSLIEPPSERGQAAGTSQSAPVPTQAPQTKTRGS